MQTTDVSVIIPTYNNVHLLEDCVRSLQEHTPIQEIVIVDNGSNEYSTRMFSNGVTYVRLPENTGFAHACNIGARVASHNFYLFLNNDTIANDDFVSPMIESFKPRVGAVGSKLLFPNGEIQHAGVDVSLTASGLLEGFEYRNEREAGPVHAVTGACMAVRKNAFWSAGGFDEGYWNGNEDIDLCLALRRDDWIVYYQPKSTLVHLVSQSGPERWSRVNQNVARFNEKWNR